MAILRMVFSSARVERDGLDDVVVIAWGIMDQLRGLCLADLVAGAHRDRLFACGGRKVEVPGPEGKAANVFAERRTTPGLATVTRHLDQADAVAGIPGDAADRHWRPRAGTRALR